MVRSFAQLPGYDVTTHIGKGAGAVIYEGRRRSDRAIVAIKHVVRRGPDDDRFIDQAETEFLVGQKVEHPSLRRIADIVRVRRWLKISELFLIMELVEGSRLEDNRPNDVDQMVQMFIAVAEGLYAMHRAGFVHADIKPNNILLVRGGGLKIIDFGQSCPIGHTKSRIQGTPDFMAPEQALRQPIDQRTDVFNLGATMYWTATGKWFKTVMNTGEMGTKKIAIDARSDNAPPHAVNARIPMTLSQLIADCCEHNKSDRPREMKDVLSRLEMIHHLIRKRNLPPLQDA